jgi:hypothetical protein
LLFTQRKVMVVAVPTPTATQALAGLLLDEPLEQVVRRLRDQGMSWQRVADHIANDTGGVIRANRETYRLWFGAQPTLRVNND